MQQLDDSHLIDPPEERHCCRCDGHIGRMTAHAIREDLLRVARHLSSAVTWADEALAILPPKHEERQALESIREALDQYDSHVRGLGKLDSAERISATDCEGARDCGQHEGGAQ